MKTSQIAQLFNRDIDKLIIEFQNYSSEEKMWIVLEGISNSGGNLGAHLLGSMNHFIGATLGKSGYVRERDKEFSDKGISRDEIISKLSETKILVEKVILGLQPEDLEKEFPLELTGKNTIEYYLVFFALHLNYHLGQINYHRRIVDKLS